MQQPANPQDGVLELRNIVKAYPGSRGPKTVLDNINLHVEEGELVAIVGPSGAGKSTLLRLILGEDEPTSGELLLDGEPLGYPDIRRGIVPQQYGLFPHLTVIDNIMLGDNLGRRFLARAKNDAQKRERVEAFLEGANLSAHRDKYPSQLSGGQRQRAAVIQALIKDPKILLMDEPFGALDPGTRERMQVFLLELWETTRRTIMFVTHDLEEAVFLAPRIVALSPYNKARQVTGASTIVFDEAVREKRRALSTESKKDPRFTETIEQIRDIAFGPDADYHVRRFDAGHLSTFQIVGRRDDQVSAFRELPS